MKIEEKTLSVRKMRGEKRRYGNREVCIGPSYITKETVEEDSCQIFFKGRFTSNIDWQNKLIPHDLSALRKQDHYGIDDYFIQYSLDKKKRWLIPTLIKDDIQDIQDPRLNYRISASVHIQDISDTYYFRTPSRSLPTVSYHDVSRDGEIITHRCTKSKNMRLERLIDPNGQPPMRVKGKVVRPRFREEFKPNTNLPIDENETYQKLHAHYFVKKLESNASKYNKAKVYHDRWNRKPLDLMSRRNRKICRKIDWNDIHVDEDQINSINIDDDVIFHDTVAEDLSEFVVRPRIKRSNRRKKTLKKFIDDVMKKGFYPPSTSYQDEPIDEEEEDDDYYEDESIAVSSHPLHSIIPDLPINIPPLPVFPHTWFIHEKNTEEILGTPMESCFVVKKINNKMYLYNVEKCFECCPESYHDQIIPPSQFFTDTSFIIPESCSICCQNLSDSSEYQGCQPFGLMCGHIFCTSCWLEHISSSMVMGTVPVQCMGFDCSMKLSFEASSAILDSDSFKMYYDQLKESLISSNELILCPECKKLHSTTSDRTLLCLCGTSICTICSSINHRPLSCNAFQQYTHYMGKNGLNLFYSFTSEAPFIRDLVQCPTCKSLMQRSEGCNHMTCKCGAQFCYGCGERWGSGHYNCNKLITTSVALIDVRSSLDYPLLIPSLLTLSIDARMILCDRKKGLIKRLSTLSPKMRRRIGFVIMQLSLQLELCYLNSRRNRNSLSAANLIVMALSRFFDTIDKNLYQKSVQLMDFYNSLAICR